MNLRTLGLTVLTLLAALVAGSAALGSPAPANACSCTDDCPIPWRDSPIIVSGQFESWRYDSPDGKPLIVRDSEDRSDGANGHAPLTFTFRVDAVLKGSAPATLLLPDVKLVVPDDRGLIWPGEQGGCFGFVEDPTSKYAVIFVGFDEQGRHKKQYHSAYYGDEPPDLDSDPNIAHFLGPYAPSAGTGLAATRAHLPLFQTLGAALIVAGAAGLLALGRR